MINYIAIYRGPTVKEAKMVAVTTDEDIVKDVAETILNDHAIQQSTGDPVIDALLWGRRSALQQIVYGIDYDWDQYPGRE